MTATMSSDSHVRVALRPYQEDALARVEAADARGVRRQLGVAATGLGKTVMFTSLAERRGGRALVLAHRDELVVQAAAKLLEVWPDLGASPDCHIALHAAGHERLARQVRVDPRGVGIVKAGANDVRAHVVVASVQTLARARRLEQLQAPMLGGDGMFGRSADPLGLVVVDEAHHATADTYRRILTALDAGEDGGPLLLGVTATADRGDGKGLEAVFDEVVFTYDLLWGIRESYLADVRGVKVTVERLDLADLEVNRGDYNQGQAGRKMEAASAHRYVLAAWQQHASDRRTLVFTPTVEVARLVAEEFTAAGVAAGYVHGGTPSDERKSLLRRYAAGEVQVLANCAVLTEGFDDPRTDCVVIARPTKSRAFYTQMVGRGTRRHPDKADLLVLDVVGVTDALSLVSLPSLFGLSKKYAKRLTDGSAAASSVVADFQEEEVRLGRIRAEDVDLLQTVRKAGFAWVQMHDEGDPLHRYTCSLPKDGDGKPQPTVVLAQRVPDEDVWTAGLLYPDGSKRVILADVALEMAQGVAEDYARSRAPAGLLDADAAWRKRKPTERQIEGAKKWRLKVDPAWTAGDLSEALDRHIARIRQQATRSKRRRQQ